MLIEDIIGYIVIGAVIYVCLGGPVITGEIIGGLLCRLDRRRG